MRSCDEALWIFFPVSDNTCVTRPTQRKIEGFKALEAGWNYGEGIPFDDSIISMALELESGSVELGFYESDAFPGANGEVMFTLYESHHYLEFTIEPNGQITYAHEINDGESEYKEGLTFEEATDKIREFRKALCKQSESSILKNTLTDGERDTQASRLTTQGEQLQEYPSSTANAYAKWIIQSASTSEYIISELQASHRHSGYLIQAS